MRSFLTTQRRSLILGAAGLGGLIVIAFVVLKLAPDWFAETKNLNAKDRADARQDVRTVSLALLAGTIGVVGAIYTARSFALNRAGQLTDRFTKAIDQIGDKKALEVRLGGIYALERIARDSKEDHPQVVEVLVAFIREHAPRMLAGPQAPESDFAYDLYTPTDVQAALTVLGRRIVTHDRREEFYLDLQGTGLVAANLRRAALGGADLSAADLRRADLGQAILRGARLTGTDLRGAHLGGADFEAADLGGADLSHSLLTEVDFTGASLHQVDLRGSHIMGTLRRTVLTGAQLSGANLARADLTEASLVDPLKFQPATYNAETIWPEGFDPEAAGAVLEDEA